MHTATLTPTAVVALKMEPDSPMLTRSANQRIGVKFDGIEIEAGPDETAAMTAYLTYRDTRVATVLLRGSNQGASLSYAITGIPGVIYPDAGGGLESVRGGPVVRPPPPPKDPQTLTELVALLRAKGVV